MKRSENQLNIHIYKSRKVSARKTTISYAKWQKFLVCASPGQIDMCRRRSLWYAQAQVKLVCAGAGHFGMRRRRSIWYA